MQDRNENCKLDDESKKKNNYYINHSKILLFAVLIGFASYIVYTDFFQNEDKVVAKVNGEEIYLSELERAYKSLQPQQKITATKKDILQELVEFKVVYLEAKNKGMAISKEEAERNIDFLLNTSGVTKEQFIENLESNEINKEDYIRNYAEEATVRNFFRDKIMRYINVSDKEINDYYINNLKNFENDGKVIVEEILVGNGTLNFSEKERIAEELLNSVKPDNFCDVKNTGYYSRCNELILADDDYPHEIKEMILSNDAGFIDIAKNSSDVYLFLISKKISPETAPFDEVYEQIKEVIKMEKARKAYSELYNSLEKKSKIKLYHKNIS